MFEYLFWQIGQLFKPFPDPKSWKYRFLTWQYDRKYGSEDELPPDPPRTYNFRFPGEFNAVIFDEPTLEATDAHAGFIIKYHKEFLLALDKMEEFAKAMKSFGISIEEVALKLKEQELNDDHNERIPEGWEPVYAFDDDPDTLIGLVDPDGRVHDKRDYVYDDPEPTA